MEKFLKSDLATKIFNSAVDGIIVINNRGIIIDANKATSKIFGYDKTELINQNVKFLMPEPNRSSHDKYIGNYIRTGEKKIIGIGRELEGMSKSGKIFPFKLSISEADLKGEQLFIGVVHDISELVDAKQKLIKVNSNIEKMLAERTKKLSKTIDLLLQAKENLESEINKRKTTEIELKKSKIELENSLSKEKELGNLKSKFVSLASHEFRTPLSTILSSTSLIQKYLEKQPNEKILNHTEKIKLSIKYLNSTLNDYLSIGKLEEGKIRVKNSTFDLSELCNEIFEELETYKLNKQTLILENNLKDSIITNDKNIIHNIIINICSNAIKYSKNGDQVNLRLNEKENNLLIEVEDKGIGIPKENQSFLFERFYRADNAMHIDGTGLGLNIVHGYIKLLNGSIDFKSEQNKGTTFFIKLPKNNES